MKDLAMLVVRKWVLARFQVCATVVLPALSNQIIVGFIS